VTANPDGVSATFGPWHGDQVMGVLFALAHWDEPLSSKENRQFFDGDESEGV
jgi:hypothetical protein